MMKAKEPSATPKGKIQRQAGKGNLPTMSRVEYDN
jgi:hypothetical protein